MKLIILRIPEGQLLIERKNHMCFFFCCELFQVECMFTWVVRTHFLIDYYDAICVSLVVLLFFCMLLLWWHELLLYAGIWSRIFRLCIFGHWFLTLDLHHNYLIWVLSRVYFHYNSFTYNNFLLARIW